MCVQECYDMNLDLVLHHVVPGSVAQCKTDQELENIKRDVCDNTE